MIFNTLCAKCHEGECSGRLSFDTGSTAATSHIKRYTGDQKISKGEIKEFFSLLNYMKTECALWMPDNGKWKPENLSNFALPAGKGYFVPLGVLKEGEYDIKIKMKEDVHFRMEVLSSDLEHFLDISACPDDEQAKRRFTVDRAVNLFLRIQSRKHLQIIDLSIKKEN